MIKQNNKKILIVLSYILKLSFTIQPYKLILVSQEQGAACLDGSPPGYYFQPGFDGGEKKFLVSFTGGGFCQGETYEKVLDECLKRSKTDLGSSKNWQETFPDSLVNSAENPFYNWNKIFIQYCDGSLHQGYNNDVFYNNTKLYFAGENNTKTILDESLFKRGMINATDVILTGMSAGGVATYFWADYLKQKLKPQTKYATAPDSGFVLNIPHYSRKEYLLQKQFKELYNVSNHQTNPPIQKCVEDNKENPFLCFFEGKFLIQYIESPIYIINSLYDYWLMTRALGLSCIDKHFSLKNCQENQIFAAENLREIYTDTLQRAVNQKDNRSIWAISCVFHVFSDDFVTFSSVLYEIPGKSGMTLNKALYEWYNNDFKKDVRIDQVAWPNNELCSSIPFTPPTEKQLYD